MNISLNSARKSSHTTVDFPGGLMTGNTKWRSGCASRLYFAQEGQTPHASVSERCLQQMNWAYAAANANLPTPGSPWSSWACGIRLSRTERIKRFLISCWPMTSLNNLCAVKWLNSLLVNSLSTYSLCKVNRFMG